MRHQSWGGGGKRIGRGARKDQTSRGQSFFGVNPQIHTLQLTPQGPETIPQQSPPQIPNPQNPEQNGSCKQLNFGVTCYTEIDTQTQRAPKE